MQFDRRQIIGWVAVGLSTLITCFWAFWGIIENFHEGWYSPSLLANLGLMFVQYLSPMIIFMSLTLISIFRPRFGAILHFVFALLAARFFEVFSNPTLFLLIMPLAVIGFLYWFGRPHPRTFAVYFAIGLPLLTLIIFGFEPVLRVSQRIDQGDLQAQTVPGNGVNLVWAPEGPGWPSRGANWFEAQEICQTLSVDGLTALSTPQNIWRLPTADEAVRSMARHGQNSGGVWHEASAETVYDMKPDKEPPLWNRYSLVIYWWTATEVDDDRAYIIVYDGRVWPRSKDRNQDNLGFRCVKRPENRNNR